MGKLSLKVNLTLPGIYIMDIFYMNLNFNDDKSKTNR